MHYDIIKATTLCQFFSCNHIVTHDAAAFAYAGSRTALDASYVLVSRYILAEEVYQQVYLLPQFYVGRKEVGNVGAVYPVDLCGIYLTFPWTGTWMQPDCCQMLGKFALVSTLLTVIKKPHAIQFYGIHITDADNATAFVNTFNTEFQRDRLHKAIVPAFFDMSSSQEGYNAIPCSINDCMRQ